MGNVLEDEVKPIYRAGIYERYIKRPLDFILSLCAVLALSPVLSFVAILVKIGLGSPVIFKQERSGLYSKISNMYKFRTITNEEDENGNPLSDEKRLTGFGKMLRSTSLGELPELFCIFSGCMSCIGPRSLLMKYLPEYNQGQLRWHRVKPSLTGYAQAHDRDSLTQEEKFGKDVYYVKYMSLWLDVMILFKTVTVVLKREGINSETSATMEEFMGVPEEETIE